ncbi:GntR family transcriptional regulator [Herbaspirillum rubrisubalbicans]|jgi:DNA-binding transcriptional MocR family regulator|uniref:GntR family transcriptional regulator n=2 Tax=Herbaspirillum rubrisubalbicans TaxID=80842 RepID=A0ABX9BX71_9BURK|nr:PLP-dependent aminotransferase family protein [Herbaspirillum rubrisubalbicans]MCP1571826.1 DNA-binding transcriptional MocR family regulator [Herbaspirillum rubrisubalbicans]NQE48343.1 GntR family transcriptional regulator [Herbaspirillum rubrisubalbicans]QJQ00505.1 PLP-dependent aminotransferase family protein [Herbaspirillum rubrisubalbicans Os34]RAM62526.1 GntR family transcriptional regulator [Herbaspirillum rubrisubalbicans]RAN50296.1 GntR family transcriptional regulator [Herbaspiril
MTNTVKHLHSVPTTTIASDSALPGWPLLLRESGESLVDQIVRGVRARIDDKLLRGGVRMPSIRQFAEANEISRFTVVEAYDRLVAQGYLESRRGSGFYVKERAPMGGAYGSTAAQAEAQAEAGRGLDVVWLVRNMFRQLPPHKMPGGGLLPPDWLDGELIANALRAVSRDNPALLLGYGTPLGFLPLRQQLQLKLAELEIAAAPEQIVLTTGVTQGLDTVARHFLRPGDVVFVDDPAWFLMFGSFAALGAKIVGIPRLGDGPDIAHLREMAALHKPKLYVINSVLHNPTSTSMSAAKAFQVLRIAEEHDFILVEDDIYCDMHPGSAVQPATRIAALDQLQRVIYLGGFSKTLSANLRVGYIATSAELARSLADRKLLSTLTTGEIGERVAYKVLSEGHYRKHAERLRARLNGAREKVMRHLEKLGMEVGDPPPCGMFLWVDTGRDTNVLTEEAMEQGFLLAPGSLFSPSQLPSTHMRINVASMSDPGIWRFLERAMAD